MRPYRDANRDGIWLPRAKLLFINDFFSNFVRNARIPLTEKEADALSSKRKLHLTIDGIHLNSQGAEVFAQIMEKHLSGFVLLNME